MIRPSPRKITRYLVANAADAGGQRYSSKLLKGVAPGSAPQRITELPKWVREHRKVPDWEWRHKDVRTKANCVACHTGAEQGYYDE
ncbi:MAG: diheme cytochrome c [Rhodocyclaceae bacterium]|nr:diheme cytochrome c [Rhodocyclaceae bacterium]